ncbi:MAG: hypothetical protein LBD53_00840 [Tannerella sp.]|nr:hypothetical protein [Tannerella sp.]
MTNALYVNILVMMQLSKSVFGSSPAWDDTCATARVEQRNRLQGLKPLQGLNSEAACQIP